MGSHYPWQGNANVPDSLPDRRRTAEIPGGGLSGTSGYEGGDTVHFMHQHVRDTVVVLEEGNLPTPTVTPMPHDGNLACSEWEATCHRPVRQGSGAEEKVVGGGGTAGEIREGLSGLWRSFR